MAAYNELLGFDLSEAMATKPGEKSAPAPAAEAPAAEAPAPVVEESEPLDKAAAIRKARAEAAAAKEAEKEAKKAEAAKKAAEAEAARGGRRR